MQSAEDCCHESFHGWKGKCGPSRPIEPLFSHSILGYLLNAMHHASTIYRRPIKYR